ncbi:PEX5-related protein [Gambusia affinis]|uniref:PEX5-related protein n=1 Tax=Gambusia affinis TaxID=33528 RepID=UPI001CDB9277|nr:PEX5-related protein [Gambusia affinis]
MYQVQESRPLLSPSIDDFLAESRSEATSGRPPTSNPAVLSTALDLVDLSDPAETRHHPVTKSPVRRTTGSRSPRHRTKTEETELVPVQLERQPARPGTPDRTSLDSVSLSSPLDKWDELDLDLEDGGRRRRCQARCTSHHSSSELLWSAEFRTDPLMKSSLDDLDFISLNQDSSVSRLRRRTRSLLARNESQEDEFVRAKAAVESDTEFWDKMQAEWEELARRNWLEESESQQKPAPPPGSPVEKGYYFSGTNPYLDWPNAFAEGQDKAREGDLNAAVLLLEAAILQDPSDAEAWQTLGTTQAENENEQAAIASLQRCLELRPNNLPALMALAASLTNSSQLPEACDALRRWIGHNHRYRHLVQSRSPLQGSPATPRRGPGCSTSTSSALQEVLLLFQEAAQLNVDNVDPDLQTGLGVLYNLSSEFDRAVEAFSAALSVRPQDYLLWNRLGATLANGSRSAEAVEAYSRALQLRPGFIRSRYNLGISCINLGALREAVSNFVTALTQQRCSQRCSQLQMSTNIWAALRIAVSMMDDPGLDRAASLGDLDLLTKTLEGGDL